MTLHALMCQNKYFTAPKQFLNDSWIKHQVRAHSGEWNLMASVRFMLLHTSVLIIFMLDGTLLWMSCGAVRLNTPYLQKMNKSPYFKETFQVQNPVQVHLDSFIYPNHFGPHASFFLQHQTHTRTPQLFVARRCLQTIWSKWQDPNERNDVDKCSECVPAVLPAGLRQLRVDLFSSDRFTLLEEGWHLGTQELTRSRIRQL